MTDSEKAKIAQSAWEYAKTVAPAYQVEQFKKAFCFRASKLFALNEQETAQVWQAAIKMYS